MNKEFNVNFMTPYNKKDGYDPTVGQCLLQAMENLREKYYNISAADVYVAIGDLIKEVSNEIGDYSKIDKMVTQAIEKDENPILWICMNVYEDCIDCEMQLQVNNQFIDSTAFSAARKDFATYDNLANINCWQFKFKKHFCIHTKGLLDTDAMKLTGTYYTLGNPKDTPEQYSCATHLVSTEDIDKIGKCIDEIILK